MIKSDSNSNSKNDSDEKRHKTSYDTLNNQFRDIFYNTLNT